MSAPADDAPRSEDERIILAIDRYLAGEARPEEVAFIRAWVSADPKREELLSDLRRIREVVGAGKRHRSAEEGWRTLLPMLQLELRQAFKSPAADRPAPRVAASRRWFRSRRHAVAAVIALAGVAAAAVLLITPRETAQPGAGPPSAQLVTKQGQLIETRLPDGSRVWLGPQSRLTVLPADDTSRNFFLDGEAYFDVARDDRRQFTVRVHNAVVQDLGTRFAVRAYVRDSLVRVLVTQGSVRLKSDSLVQSAGTVLTAGMVGRVTTAGVVSAQKVADTARYLGFTRGQIILVNRPLRDAVREIERWYDIHIELADPRMGDRRITATIADQTLPALLQQLGIALNVRVSRTGGTVVLSDAPNPR
jgi:ferric-dicitrate binding protein FerR (iron transport regulator)